jgi:hypothetical protein
MNQTTLKSIYPTHKNKNGKELVLLVSRKIHASIRGLPSRRPRMINSTRQNVIVGLQLKSYNHRAGGTFLSQYNSSDRKNITKFYELLGKKGNKIETLLKNLSESHAQSLRQHLCNMKDATMKSSIKTSKKGPKNRPSNNSVSLRLSRSSSSYEDRANLAAVDLSLASVTQEDFLRVQSLLLATSKHQLLSAHAAQFEDHLETLSQIILLKIQPSNQSGSQLKFHAYQQLLRIIADPQLSLKYRPKALAVIRTLCATEVPAAGDNDGIPMETGTSEVSSSTTSSTNQVNNVDSNKNKSLVFLKSHLLSCNSMSAAQTSVQLRLKRAIDYVNDENNNVGRAIVGAHAVLTKCNLSPRAKARSIIEIVRSPLLIV